MRQTHRYLCLAPLTSRQWTVWPSRITFVPFQMAWRGGCHLMHPPPRPKPYKRRLSHEISESGPALENEAPFVAQCFVFMRVCDKNSRLSHEIADFALDANRARNLLAQSSPVVFGSVAGPVGPPNLQKSPLSCGVWVDWWHPHTHVLYAAVSITTYHASYLIVNNWVKLAPGGILVACDSHPPTTHRPNKHFLLANAKSLNMSPTCTECIFHVGDLHDRFCCSYQCTYKLQTKLCQKPRSVNNAIPFEKNIDGTSCFCPLPIF